MKGFLYRTPLRWEGGYASRAKKILLASKEDMLYNEATKQIRSFSVWFFLGATNGPRYGYFPAGNPRKGRHCVYEGNHCIMHYNSSRRPKTTGLMFLLLYSARPGL